MYIVHDVKHDAILTVKAAEGAAVAFHRQLLRAADKWRRTGLDPSNDVAVVNVAEDAKKVAAKLNAAGDVEGEAVALYASGLSMSEIIRGAQYQRDGSTDVVRHALYKLGRRNARERAIRFVMSQK